MWLYHSEDMKVLICIFNNDKNEDEKGINKYKRH